MSDSKNVSKGINYIGLFLGIFLGAFISEGIYCVFPLDWRFWDNFLMACGMSIFGFMGSKFMN